MEKEIRKEFVGALADNHLHLEDDFDSRDTRDTGTPPSPPRDDFEECNFDLSTGNSVIDMII